MLVCCYLIKIAFLVVFLIDFFNVLGVHRGYKAHQSLSEEERWSFSLLVCLQYQSH